MAKRAPEQPRAPRERRRAAPRAAKSTPRAAKSAPRAARSAPRVAKSTPRAARSAPRAAKSTPRVPQERPGEAFLEVFRWFHEHSVKITFLNENNLIRLRILFDMICITENVLKRRFPFTAGSGFFLYVGAFLASKIDQKIDSKINMFFDRFLDRFWSHFGGPNL